MKKYKKVPPQNEYQKFLKKKTPPKKNNNAKYNHKQILDNCKKKKKLDYLSRENLSQILSINQKIQNTT